MPSILVVAATPAEIEPFTKHHGIDIPGNGLFVKENIIVLITGAGMVATAFAMGKLIGTHVDVAINAGLAGSFTKFNTGEVVSLNSDCFSELGAEDDSKFITIDALGLGEQHVELELPLQHPCLEGIPTASGITVNTVHGNEKSISKVIEKYQPYVESMEGAAFIYCVNQFKWRGLQLRAISNLVEKRNKNSWQIPKAVENLNAKLITIVDALSKSLT
jgi:futalosine hydrolase